MFSFLTYITKHYGKTEVPIPNSKVEMRALADLREAPGTRIPGSKFFHFNAVFSKKIG